MSGLPIDPLIGRLQTVLDLREQQHSMTAANLANAATPGYRASHLDFRSALGDVVRGESKKSSTEIAQESVVELDPPPWAVDENSVLPEREMARLQENSMLYGGVARGLSRKLAILKFAAGNGR
jgi:flagellar basal-body rod protein FlgB